MPNKYTQPPRENKNAAASPRSGPTGKIEFKIERYRSGFGRLTFISAPLVAFSAPLRNTTFDIAHETLTFQV
jgi:hypothetical protein